MLSKYTKLILIACLLLGILLCILECVSVIPYINLKGDPNSLPVRSLTITIDVNQRQEFLNQLQKFADKHFLEITLPFYDVDGKAFLVPLYGNGFHITSVANVPTFPREEIDIGFYNESSPPTSQETFDDLYNDFKNFLVEIPNVIIKEKLKSLIITVDKNQREELLTETFTQLRKFADQRSLKFTASSYDEGYKIFVVTIYGDGFQITSEAVRGRLTEIVINFYIEFDNKIPTPTSQETVDELFNDLKSFFGKIPNVTISDGK